MASLEFNRFSMEVKSFLLWLLVALCPLSLSLAVPVSSGGGRGCLRSSVYLSGLPGLESLLLCLGSLGPCCLLGELLLGSSSVISLLESSFGFVGGRLPRDTGM